MRQSQPGGCLPGVEGDNAPKARLRRLKIAQVESTTGQQQFGRRTASAGPFKQIARSGECAQIGQKPRSEEHTSELQSLMRISYDVFCLKKKNKKQPIQ